MYDPTKAIEFLLSQAARSPDPAVERQAREHLAGFAELRLRRRYDHHEEAPADAPAAEQTGGES